MFPSKQKFIAAFSTKRNLSGGRFNFSSRFGGKFKILNWHVNIQTMRNSTFMYAQSPSCSTPQNTSQRVGWGSIPRQWIEYSIDKWLRNTGESSLHSTLLFWFWCLSLWGFHNVLMVHDGYGVNGLIPSTQIHCFQTCVCTLLCQPVRKGYKFWSKYPPPQNPDYSTIQCSTSESF